MTLMFPRIFCITLPETPDRKAKAQAHFRERSVRDVHFFDGIHAEQFGLKTVFPYEVDNPGSGYTIGFKSVGNVLSHYVLWSALNLLHDDLFLVLEDDAQFPEDWHLRTIAALRDVPPDFDMLYLGSCCCEGRPKTLVRGNIFAASPMCTHAYVVAKKALPILLRTQRKIYAPVDISLAFHSHPHLKVFACLPRIVEQFDTVIPP